MELLAPAGNFECLKAAIACGADAVYLGVEKYGARASARNFGFDDLAKALDFAHVRGVKIYLTVNTLIKDSEMSDAIDTVTRAKELGVDAFIVQDLGLINEINKSVPDAILHASTQMGICNSFGAAFVKKLGFNRVVFARESLMSDIKSTIEETGLETEVFCQGALCVAYSGNCYYSSLVSGYSGNRGRCLQLCRKKYEINGRSGYYLSAKDICLLDKVAQLKDAGVTSLKIEGRMRTPEYVAESVAVYRNAIDGKSVPNDITRLKKVFNRGDYCKAYLGDPTENVIYSKAQNNIGLKCGKVIGIKNRKAILDTSPKLEIGDGVKYMRDGYEVGGGEIRGLNATSYTGNIKIGDDVCLTSQVALKNKVKEFEARLPVKAAICLNTKFGATLSLSCGQQEVNVTGRADVVWATNTPVSEEDVRAAVGTLGGTDFILKDITVNVQDGVFYPVSVIKEMRKAAVTELTEKLKTASRLNAPHKNSLQNLNINFEKLKKNAVFVQISDGKTLDKIAFEYDYLIYNPTDYGNIQEIERDLKSSDAKIFLNLPMIARGEDLQVLSKLKNLPFAGYIANNVSHFEMFDGKPFIGGLGLNILNKSFQISFINSVESDSAISDSIKYAYGKPPLMHFAHCPKKTAGGNCKNCNSYSFKMKDDKGITTEFHRIKEKYCYSVLIPSVPVNNIEKFRNTDMLIDLSFASFEEIEAVNGQILKGNKYNLPYTHANAYRILY